MSQATTSNDTNKRTGPRWMTSPEVRAQFGEVLPQQLKNYLSVALGNFAKQGKVRRREADWLKVMRRVGDADPRMAATLSRAKYEYNVSDLRKLFRSKYNVEV